MTFDHQKQMRSQGGASLWGCCALVPADRPQACRDSYPIADGALFDVDSCKLGGGFARRPFHSSLLSGSLPALSEGDRSGSLPVAGRHPLSRGGPEGVRFTGAPLFRRLNLQLRKHADRQIANAYEAHVRRLPSAAGFDVQQRAPKGDGSAQIQVGVFQNVYC